MLLDDIIKQLSEEGASLTEALLKTKVLLHQLGRKELVEWVNKELNGYSEEDDFPSYRILPSQVLANLSNPAWRIASHPIPLGHLKPGERESLERAKMHQSLDVLRELTKAKGGMVSRSIPIEANFLLGETLDNSFRIERA